MNILDIRVEDLPSGTTHYDLIEYDDFNTDSCLKVDSKGCVHYCRTDGGWIEFSDSLDKYLEGMEKSPVPPVTIQAIIDAQITDKNRLLPTSIGLKDLPEPEQVVKEALEEIQEGRPSPYHLLNILGDKKYFDYYDFIDCGRATGHVQRPEAEHVLKKLFVPYRGHKSELIDVKECIRTLEGLRDKLIKEGEDG